MGDGQGCFIAVIGPSGSGKDALIDWARPYLDENGSVMFVRRTVTREALEDAEDHDTLDPKDFDRAETQGRFAITWSAHGLRYGIPAEALDHVRAGGIAIANGSRRALDQITGVFGNVVAVQLTVERDVLAERLRARGRESAAEIDARLARIDESLPAGFRSVAIDNSGPLEVAGQQFLQFVESEFDLMRDETLRTG